MRRATTAALTATILVAVAAACEPAPPPTPAPKPVQIEGSTLVEGDSLTVQTALGLGELPGQVHSGLGWTATDCLPAQNPGCVPASRNVVDRVAEGEVDRLVWALGSNDAADRYQGFTTEDELYWTQVFNALPAESCLVIVTPFAVDPYSQTAQSEYEEAAQWGRNFAAGRPNTFVVEWAPVAQLGPDGLHLSTAEPVSPWGISVAAAQARATLINDGLARCV